MIKYLVRHGRSWAFVIDKPILELIELTPDTPLKISIEGQTLKISRASESTRQDEIGAASSKINLKHAKAFKELAD